MPLFCWALLIVQSPEASLKVRLSVLPVSVSSSNVPLPVLVMAPLEMVPTDVKFLLLKVMSVPPELIDRLFPLSLVIPPRAFIEPVE